MMEPIKSIKKLRKPPAVQNWVRHMQRRTDDTALALFNFVKNAPRHSLSKIYSIIKQVVVDGISDEQAYKCLAKIENPRVQEYGDQILKPLLPYIRARGWQGIEIFKDMAEFYPVGANVNVPVRPTFVINDDGQLVPYFVIGWTEIGLSLYQKRIFSTIVTETILSLEEFIGSDAVIVCVPRYKFSKTEREDVSWKASSYELLSIDEKADLFDRYGNALNQAEQMILNELGA